MRRYLRCRACLSHPSCEERCRGAFVPWGEETVRRLRLIERTVCPSCGHEAPLVGGRRAVDVTVRCSACLEHRLTLRGNIVVARAYDYVIAGRWPRWLQPVWYALHSVIKFGALSPREARGPTGRSY